MKKFIFLLIVTPLIFSGCVEDPCATVICLNNGEEITQGDECFCDCPAGFEGANCQDEIMADPCETVVCLNDGICMDGTCDCPDGFMGENCEEQDPCLDVTCTNGVFLITDGVCACECDEGFTGDDCSLDIILTEVTGDWNASDQCEMYGYNEPFSYTSTIIEDMMGSYQIVNFGAIDTTLAFAATIEDNVITIPLSEVSDDTGSLLVEGTGILTAGRDTINWTYSTEYEVEVDGEIQKVIDNCTGIWTK